MTEEEIDLMFADECRPREGTLPEPDARKEWELGWARYFRGQDLGVYVEEA